MTRTPSQHFAFVIDRARGALALLALSSIGFLPALVALPANAQDSCAAAEPLCLDCRQWSPRLVRMADLERRRNVDHAQLETAATSSETERKAI